MLLLCISDWQAKQRAESLGFVRLHLYLPGRGRLSALPERHTVGVKAPIAAVYRSAEATAVRQPGSLLPCVRRGRSAGRPSVKNTPLLHPAWGERGGRESPVSVSKTHFDRTKQSRVGIVALQKPSNHGEGLDLGKGGEGFTL